MGIDLERLFHLMGVMWTIQMMIWYHQDSFKDNKIAKALVEGLLIYFIGGYIVDMCYTLNERFGALLSVLNDIAAKL